MYDEQLETEYGKLMNIQVLDDRGYEYNLKFGIKSEPGTSTKTVLNSEYNYSLPATLTKKTGTEISSYNVYDSTGTTDTGIALEDNNSTFMNSVKAVANTLKGTDTNIKTDTATNQKYVEVKAVSSGKATQNATDEVVVTDGSIYTDKVIRVYLEDTTSYTYTDSSGNAAELDINDKALAALYTVDTTDTSGNTYNRISGGGIKVIKKQYTDGGEDQTDYEIYLTNADNTVSGGKLTGLSYSDLVSFIPTDQAVSSTYTTTETMETGSKAGSYVLTLVGMTDSDGEEVTGWDGLDVAKNGVKLIYDTGDGSFISVDGGDAFTVALSTIGTGNFSNVSFDMTNTSNVNNGGKSTVAGIRDDGYKVGQLTGVSVGQDGTITANYDNGMQKSIAQIAVATFANSMGLENVGDNLYQQTSNSGEFDGVGIDIKGVVRVT
jgi:flagellar hook protein FlgE